MKIAWIIVIYQPPAIRFIFQKWFALWCCWFYLSCFRLCLNVRKRIRLTTDMNAFLSSLLEILMYQNLPNWHHNQFLKFLLFPVSFSPCFRANLSCQHHILRNYKFNWTGSAMNKWTTTPNAHITRMHNCLKITYGTCAICEMAKHEQVSQCTQRALFGWHLFRSTLVPEIM